MTRQTNPWDMTELEAGRARLNEFNEQCGGLMRLCLARPDDLALIAAVRLHEPFAMVMARSVSHSLNDISARVGTHPVQCMTCDHKFDLTDPEPPYAFVIWVPGLNEDVKPDLVMASPVCRGCAAQSDHDLLEDALAMSKRLWGGVEVIAEELKDGTD